VLDLLYAFELVVAFWVVVICLTDVVGENLHPARLEHHHHHRRPRARQPGDNGNRLVIHCLLILPDIEL